MLNISLEVFNELQNYHFLWKFESNMSATDLRKNVIIRSWLPVSDMLADSKTKAVFIHGGLLTTQEAVWRGVPMTIMPLGFDQHQVRILLLVIHEDFINIHFLEFN